jgi:hypothetical protein
MNVWKLKIPSPQFDCALMFLAGILFLIVAASWASHGSTWLFPALIGLVNIIGAVRLIRRIASSKTVQGSP